MDNKNVRKRIQNDVNKLLKSDQRGVLFELEDIDELKNNLSKLSIKLFMPKDTIYEDGEMDVEINFPDDYPFSAPRVEFKSPTYHHNINKSGSVCLDILRSSQWVPTTTIESLLLMLVDFLLNPNPADALRSSDLVHPFNNKEEYKKQVRNILKIRTKK